jgi:hypothetical protein
MAFKKPSPYGEIIFSGFFANYYFILLLIKDTF